jgi:hypothetical protein
LRETAGGRQTAVTDSAAPATTRGGSGSMDIVARAQGMLTRPREEWAVVAGEPGDTKSLLMGYAVPLAAIPAAVGFLVSLMTGVGIIRALFLAIVQYVLSLVGIWLVSKIVEMLAPRFGGMADEPQAVKLVMYSYTAAWIASIVGIIPLIGWIVALLGALYSLYTFYIGAPIVMRVAENRAFLFTLAVIICAIIVNMLIGVVLLLFI